MKKTFLFLACSCALAMPFTSCNDDDPDGEFDDSKLPPIETGAYDIANGYNILIVDVDKADEFSLQLGTKKNVIVRALDEEKFPANLSIVTDDDMTRFLTITSFKDNVDTDVFSHPEVFDLEISLKDGSVKKTLKMVFRKVGSTGTVEEYARKIGMGTNVTAEMGNTAYPVLSFEHIADRLSDASNQEGTFVEFSGSRYDETMEHLTQSLGFGGNGVVNQSRHLSLSGDAAFALDKNTVTSKNFEFYAGYYQKNMAEVKLNADFLAEYQDSNTLYALLDETANDAFNNPNSSAYKKYSNDSEGIFDLLDNYGTHVIMQGTFGGSYIVFYVRQENAYETTVGCDASASMKLTKGSETAAKTWLEQYQKKTGSQYISADLAGSDYSSDYKDASCAYSIITTRGGNADGDIDEWDSAITADNKETWVLISYKTKNSGDDGRLMKISEFITDEARKEAVEQYFDQYLMSKTTELEEDTLVLADFYMKTEDKWHNSGEPKSFAALGPDGKTKLIYFPVMATDVNPYGDQDGYALETNQDGYVVGTTNKSHYWFYALSYDSKCDGITNIRFDNYEHSGWDRRGNNANDGITGALDNNYVMVQYGTSTTPCSDKIKAVALLLTDGDLPSDRIIGSSGGSEKQEPFSSTENINAFNDYWNGSYQMYDGTKFYEGGLVFNDRFQIIYNKKNLNITNLCFGSNPEQSKILHPKKWN